jgi:hypothetical protein
MRTTTKSPWACWLAGLALAGAGCSADTSSTKGDSSAGPGGYATRSPGAGAPGTGGSGGGSSTAGTPAPISPAPSSTGGTGGAAGSGMGTSAGPPAGGGGTSGTPPPTAPPGMSPPVPQPPPPQDGLLTAGSWDDNLNFDFYKMYGTKTRTLQLPGFPDTGVSDRLVVLVARPGGGPVAGAGVALVKAQGQTEVAHTRTGADGRALFFPGWSGVATGTDLQVIVEQQGIRATAAARAGDALVTVPFADGAVGVTGLDVAIVIDTTGSMGDEISYLHAELLGISQRIRELYPQISQRWAFVAYRDYQDDYVTRTGAFTEDLDSFRGAFGLLGAAGGGDYEEAPERGLAEMNRLAWRDGAVARVAFWVGDAPHHAQHGADVVAALADARAAGVHVYPISASGTDELLEYTMRLGALVTGGRYLFLTNDSGIGDNHKEPTIPCYQVTTLQKAMQRMIQMELTGTRVDPAPADILRTGGNPQDGRCMLQGGEIVNVL